MVIGTLTNVASRLLLLMVHCLVPTYFPAFVFKPFFPFTCVEFFSLYLSFTYFIYLFDRSIFTRCISDVSSGQFHITLKTIWSCLLKIYSRNKAKNELKSYLNAISSADSSICVVVLLATATIAPSFPIYRRKHSTLLKNWLEFRGRKTVLASLNNLHKLTSYSFFFTETKGFSLLK
jgi:hypothetical protein